MDIYSSICAIMGEITAVGKDKKNQQQGFVYRGIDDVMNAIQPLLAKHKVFAVPEILEQRREERQSSRGGNLIYSICKIKYTFYAEDGSSVAAVTIGEPPASVPVYRCEQCGAEIKAQKSTKGEIIPPAQVAAISKQRHGRVLCAECMRAVK